MFGPRKNRLSRIDFGEPRRLGRFSLHFNRTGTPKADSMAARPPISSVIARSLSHNEQAIRVYLELESLKVAHIES